MATSTIRVRGILGSSPSAPKNIQQAFFDQEQGEISRFEG